ncbi:hypothetical protein ANCDUO_24456 [Ancylostoma duodenale]|uniref:Carboxylesterase type B domain-containing protein n=1 Tax=Ancylostoma duodenale TaxID=51022 RepID=A0A0C2BNV6_9BILA|nr:hypothetical protein ANCDUO_24456 [Ancylostoma duodenale]
MAARTSCAFNSDSNSEPLKPVKKTRWHQELSAVEYGPPCIQFMDFHRYDKYSAENMKRQSEDCLYLNVFSPYDHEDESKTFPIIVWIHGGSFLAGSADTGIDMETIARNIIFKGITFVTINYRLGPLGKNFRLVLCSQY